MKLLVSCVPYDGGKSGISYYIRCVVAELQAAGHDLTLLVEPGDRDRFPGCRVIELPGWTRRAVFSMLYFLFILPFQIKKGAYDRVIITAANRRMPGFLRVEGVAVVHDLSQYHVPAKYDLFRMFYIKHLLPIFVRRAASVVAISRSTADDLVRFWRVPAGKITVSYDGIDRANLPLGENDGTDPTVLYVSRIEVPGKNHLNLIKAWELLPDELTGRYKLIMPGADWGGAEQVHRVVENSPKRASMSLPGFLPTEELKRLFRHGRLYVFPSFFEGFGLSLAEAMACGMIACCSNNSSLGEIAGDAALTFDPADPAAIAEAMRRALTDDTLRAELRERGLRRAELFDWKLHAAVLTGEFDQTTEVFGVRFGTGTMEQALGDIDRAIQAKRPHPLFAAFINADCLNKAFKDASYRALLNRADRVWADGVGVAIAAKHLKTPVRGNVNGTDMLPLLCDRGCRLFLLGAAPGVAAKAAERLKTLHPAVQIAGTRDGYFKPEEEKAVIAEINAARPEILLVAMGAPRQDFWIERNREALECPVAIGVGGLLDFASGRIPRAPMWMRKTKIEWIYRLRQEPTRLFRRYIIGNPLFLWRVYSHSRPLTDTGSAAKR